MGKFRDTALKYILLILVLSAASFLVHEATHWVQLSFDPDLEPTGLSIVPAGTIAGADCLLVPAPAVIIGPRHAMSQEEFSSILESRRGLMEGEAYAVQFAFIILPVLVALKRRWLF
jgi:hypothetical protein